MNYHKLSDTERFFYDNAGFAYRSGAGADEREFARIVRAIELADAEVTLRSGEAVSDWEVDDARAEDGGPAFVCRVTLGEDVEVLGGIDVSGDTDYGRVVEAELTDILLDRQLRRERTMQAVAS